jgi:hypothetical protein
MGLEGESTNRVKFQMVPASTKRERNSNPADTGKKADPLRFANSQILKKSGSETLHSRDNFFTWVQDLFDEALSPLYGTSLLGCIMIKGNVLRGW